MQTEIGRVNAQFVVKETDPHFMESGLNTASVEMFCEIIGQVVLHERQQAGVSEDEDDVNIINRLRILLWTLSEKVRYREGELLIAQLLFLRFYQSNIDLELFQNCVDLFFVVLVCLLLGHKLSTDNPCSNSYWCFYDVSNVDQKTLDNCEIYVLKKLNYNAWITEKEYEERKNMLEKRKAEINF
jgi:hypothetical protein